MLEATGTEMESFAGLVTGAPTLHNSSRPNPGRRIPLLGLAQAGSEGYFGDGGYPVGGGWDEISTPELSDPNAYALEISGDSMEPVFRDGDTIIVSPNSPVRRGTGWWCARRGGGHGQGAAAPVGTAIELASLNPAHPNYSFDLSEIAWMHRILWASQ
ncbi:helix-turn-helix transcriptional regulator [Pseudoroseomonas wenyumeiae]